MECWSAGVLENRRQDKHLLGMEMDVEVILFSWISRNLDHYSNTPPLHYSGLILWQGRSSLTPDGGIFDWP